MKKISNFFKPRIPLVIFLIAYLLFALLTYKHYGISFDERDVYLRGKLFYTKVRGNDKILQKDFVIPREGSQLLYYNNVYGALLYAVNDGENFETYHLLNMLFAISIFIVLYEVLLNTLKKPLIAILGPIFLFFTPRFFGDIPSNPKDIPFAIFYFLTLAAILFTEKSESKLRILILGIAFGITQSVRIAGYIVYPVYVVYKLISLYKKGFRWPAVKDFLLEFTLITLIAYLINIFSMPYLGADPFNNFFELVNVGKDFHWTGNLVLFGMEFPAKSRPWFYLPTWFLITTPLFIIVLSFIGIFCGRKFGRIYTLFTLSIGINLGIFFVTRPVIYDGIRHMVYLLPQVAVLAALGMIIVWQRFSHRGKYILLSLIVFNMVLVTKNYIALHPYEYVYFNELVGGVKGAYNKFETDYWGLSNKEATEWIRDTIASKADRKISVDVCGTSFTVIYYFSPNMYYANNRNKADYVVCWERFGDNEKLKGEIVHSITRQGVPLVHIYKIKK